MRGPFLSHSDAHRLEALCHISAHARRRALERLDGARVIVRLHLERGTEANCDEGVAATVSPMSITPAFSSPAFTSTSGPVVGNFRSSRLVFL